MSKEELLKAYSETTYIIPKLNITKKIGELNLELNSVLEKIYSNSWTFVTAENPRLQALINN